MVKFPINVLLVDDERDFVEILSLRLTDAGHQVRTVFSGQEALSVLAESEGYMLPEIDGIIGISTDLVFDLIGYLGIAANNQNILYHGRR